MSLVLFLIWINGDGWGSEQIPVGAQLEPLNDVERFLCMLRFDSRGKLNFLGVDFEIGKEK